MKNNFVGTGNVWNWPIANEVKAALSEKRQPRYRQTRRTSEPSTTTLLAVGEEETTWRRHCAPRCRRDGPAYAQRGRSRRRGRRPRCSNIGPGQRASGRGPAGRPEPKIRHWRPVRYRQWKRLRKQGSHGSVEIASSLLSMVLRAESHDSAANKENILFNSHRSPFNFQRSKTMCCVDRLNPQPKSARGPRFALYPMAKF